MTAKNGLPCKKCGENNWNKRGDCATCSNRRACKWAKDNPKKMSRNGLKWKKKNPDKAKEYQKRSRAKNPERHAADQRRRRARIKGTDGDFTLGEWKALCKQYDNHCIYPGCEKIDLQPDHVIPLSKGGSNDISNIQPLCKQHNQEKSDKHIDYRYKPGQERWQQGRLL